LVPLAVLASACAQKNGVSAPPTQQAPRQASETPSEVLLFDPKVTFVEPNIIQFEVKYRFTKGQPDKYYACDVSFPGTENHGVRLMESWELKTEGMIKDGIVLSKPPVKSFAIQVSEAPSPMERYQKISNVVSGPVP
jgi:hypothetical protein